MRRHVLTLFFLFCISGCGPDAFATALRIQSVANVAAIEARSEASELLLSHAETEETACADEACVLAVDARYRPQIAALALTREIALDWNAAIARGTSAGPGDDQGVSVLRMIMSFAERFARNWSANSAAISQALHIDIPALPPLVQTAIPLVLTAVDSSIGGQ